MGSSPAIDQTQRALKRLRKDEGLSLAKLYDDPDLRAVFSDYQPLALYNFIALGLESILSGLPADAARTALNVKVKRPKDDTGAAAKGNLTSRRNKLAARWGKADMLDDHAKLGAVRVREDEGLLELAVWLVGMASRFIGQAGPGEKPFVWASEDTTYIYRRGLLRQVYYEAEIRALEAGVDFLSIVLPVHVGDSRLPDAPRPIYGCSVDADVHSEAVHLDVRLSRNLHFGEVHRLAIQLDVYDVPYNILTTPLTRREQSTLRIQFDQPHPYRLLADGKVASVDLGGYFWRTWREFGADVVTTEIEWGNDDARAGIARMKNGL